MIGPKLGTAAPLDVGIGAANVVQLNSSAQLPAVDGSLLTNLPGAASYSLPVWTFQASDNSTPTTGKFTTNSATLSSITQINLSCFQKNGPTINLDYLIASFPGGSLFALQLTSLSTGLTVAWAIGNISEDSVTATFGVASFGAVDNSIPLSGDYAVLIWPYSFANLTQDFINANSSVSPLDGDYVISSTLGGSVHFTKGVATAWTPAA